MLEKRTYSGSIKYFPKRKISNPKTRDLYGSWVCGGTFGNPIIRISEICPESRNFLAKKSNICKQIKIYFFMGMSTGRKITTISQNHFHFTITHKNANINNINTCFCYPFHNCQIVNKGLLGRMFSSILL
jgi:hypothetical protein